MRRNHCRGDSSSRRRCEHEEFCLEVVRGQCGAITADEEAPRSQRSSNGSGEADEQEGRDPDSSKGVYMTN